MTTRRRMLLVAIVAVCVVVIRWHASWSLAHWRMANYHIRERPIASVSPNGAIWRGVNARGNLITPERDRWHAEMASKYYRAAFFPWLPMEKDTPIPP